MREVSRLPASQHVLWCFGEAWRGVLCAVNASSLEELVATARRSAPPGSGLRDADEPHGMVRSRLASMLRGSESNMM